MDSWLSRDVVHAQEDSWCLDTRHLYGIPLWDGLRMLCISMWTTRDPEIAGPDERSRSPDLRVRSPDPGSEMGPEMGPFTVRDA